jgi:hypothetical protein
MSGPIGTAVASGGRCATCDVELAGPFCHRCGEPGPHEADLAVRHLLHDAVHDLTHLDGKIWRTIRALLVQPGLLTKEYWEGRRGLWIRPFRLYLSIYILHLLLLPNVAGPLAFRFAAYRDANGKPHISVGTIAMHFYSFENILSAAMAPVTALVPEPVRPVFILIPVVYIFLMLRRVFGQNVWLTALKTVPVLLLFVIIEARRPLGSSSA